MGIRTGPNMRQNPPHTNRRVISKCFETSEQCPFCHLHFVYTCYYCYYSLLVLKRQWIWSKRWPQQSLSESVRIFRNSNSKQVHNLTQLYTIFWNVFNTLFLFFRESPHTSRQVSTRKVAQDVYTSDSSSDSDSSYSEPDSDSSEYRYFSMSWCHHSTCIVNANVLYFRISSFNFQCLFNCC